MSGKQNIRDHKRRVLAAKYELRRKLYKAFIKDPDLPSDLRYKHRYKLSKLPRNSSFARVRNRCILTGRPRSVYELFRISRIVFRGLASRGSLMGINKSSW
uniref:Small ribosomal subunit protein uS14m n=1 Tax=Balanophora laxiflora TaxID=1128103 RepID=A0A3Q9JNW5_9MAGN|nr:ribosomal protein S14 [Balanophora laxiflora]UPI49023.1 ribosomal protein S14 [Balanophora laxiflora]